MFGNETIGSLYRAVRRQKLQFATLEHLALWRNLFHITETLTLGHDKRQENGNEYSNAATITRDGNEIGNIRTIGLQLAM